MFRGWEHLSVASPVMVMLLITRWAITTLYHLTPHTSHLTPHTPRVSGIPLLEASGLARWGGEAEYQRYLREVPSLVPFLRY